MEQILLRHLALIHYIIIIITIIILINFVIIIIIITIISFMQGIYTHIPDTNYVPREYSVAAILLLLFMVLLSLLLLLNLSYFINYVYSILCSNFLFFLSFTNRK